MTGRFDYIKYDAEAEKAQSIFKALFVNLSKMIGALPRGRAQALALTKIEESYMWVGKAIRDNQLERTGQGDLQEGRKDG